MSATLLVLTAVFVVLLVVGVPVGYGLALSALAALAVSGEVPLVLLAAKFFNGLDSFQLLAVPLFILMGELMKESGLSQRIIDLCRCLVGHMRAGLAQVNVLANLMMGSVSGSALADTAAVGSILIPAMIRDGYRRDFAAVVTASASFLAPLVPPGIAAIIYGSITGVSIAKLFLAGIVPALVIAVVLMLVNVALAGWAGGKSAARATRGETWRALKRAWAALLLPFIFIVGLRSGVFTVTEAAAIGVLYAAIYSLATVRLGVRRYLEMIVRSARVTSSAFVVIGGAGLCGWVLTREGVGRLVLQAMTGFTTDPVGVMLLLIVILTLVGTVLEIIPAMILCVPILQPIVKTMGFDPVHFGTIVIMTLLIGSLTPPVGLVAMLACRIAGVAYNRAMGIVFLYSLLLTGVIVVIALFPGLIRWVYA